MKYLKNFAVAVGILTYLLLGWHIGKNKYEIWHGENGYAALKTMQISKTSEEEYLQTILFPISTFQTRVLLNSKTPNEPVGLYFFSKQKLLYVFMHSVLGLPYTLLWHVVLNVLMINIMFPLLFFVATMILVLQNFIIALFFLIIAV